MSRRLSDFAAKIIIFSELLVLRYNELIMIKKNMTKNKLNFIVDSLAFVAFLIAAKTGLIIFFFLPAGIQRGGYQEFWGIQKSTYSAIHDWAGIILAVLVIVHIVSHWQWITFTIKSFFQKPPAAGSEPRTSAK